LVGRSRRRHDVAFADDVKHYLYREYLHIIEALRPPVFVMENVKGLLSHRLAGQSVFRQILEDLRRPGYEVRSFVTREESLRPEDYVIRAEEYGVPQRRHRVILLGVRSDLAHVDSGVLTPRPAPTVDQVIAHMPKIRSRISPARLDDVIAWRTLRDQALVWAGDQPGGAVPRAPHSPHEGHMLTGSRRGMEGWLTGGRPSAVVQHEARGHMPADLQRYAYFAAMARRGEIIKVTDLPSHLRPLHKNVARADVPFADRFRVQLSDRPSTTVVSHIAKDGHYYIHPDPDQMRSLSVREAARLQTFPDDYFFCGNRTQQYHQVGNAVPPFLARQLAQVVHGLLVS
jgi:DNA (cytosine-5)-methyltransferase 1